MEKIIVKSKMNEEDFKKFLFYNQYYAERYYFIIQISASIIIALISAYFSSDKLSTFVIITIICTVVFIAFPWLKIKFNYKKIYRRNRSTAFSQNQVFEFDCNRIGFKNEYEESCYFEEYENLSRVIETNTLFIICYAKSQNAIFVKEMAGEDNVNKIRRIILSNIKDKYTRITRF